MPDETSVEASVETTETIEQSGWSGARTAKRVGLALAAGAGIALAAGGAALATGDSPSPTPSPSGGTESGTTPDRGSMPDRPFGHRHFGGPEKIRGFGFPLHGEFVVPDRDGSGYQTIAVQRGTADAVSSSSIRLKSADGFTKTYVVTKDTLVNAKRDGIDSVKTGDTVSLSATVDGSTSTATRIDDLSLLRQGGFLGRHLVPDPKSKSETENSSV